MYQNRNHNMYIHQYIIIFLIYIVNTIKYFLEFIITKKIKVTKKQPKYEYNLVGDEEHGICDLDYLLVFNQNTNNLIKQCYVKSKSKQD